MEARRLRREKRKKAKERKKRLARALAGQDETSSEEEGEGGALMKQLRGATRDEVKAMVEKLDDADLDAQIKVSKRLCSIGVLHL